MGVDPPAQPPICMKIQRDFGSHIGMSRGVRSHACLTKLLTSFELGVFSLATDAFLSALAPFGCFLTAALGLVVFS